MVKETEVDVGSVITKPGLSIHTCRTCKESFSFNKYQAHLRDFHGPAEKWPCGICDQVLDNNTKLKTHHRTHLGFKPFCCGNCGKEWASQSLLELHMLSHTAEKQFPCQTCEKSFKRKGGLSVHRREVCKKKQPDGNKNYDGLETLRDDQMKGQDDQGAIRGSPPRSITFGHEPNTLSNSTGQSLVIVDHPTASTSLPGVMSCRVVDCMKTFHSSQQLHVMEHTSQPVHKCIECDLLCRSSGHLETHKENCEELPHKQNNMEDRVSYHAVAARPSPPTSNKASLENGRPCIACKKSTDLINAILCNGCNDLYHTTCAGLEKIPWEKWICVPCERSFIEKLYPLVQHENDELLIFTLLSRRQLAVGLLACLRRHSKKWIWQPCDWSFGTKLHLLLCETFKEGWTEDDELFMLTLANSGQLTVGLLLEYLQELVEEGRGGSQGLPVHDTPITVAVDEKMPQTKEPICGRGNGEELSERADPVLITPGRSDTVPLEYSGGLEPYGQPKQRQTPGRSILPQLAPPLTLKGLDGMLPSSVHSFPHIIESSSTNHSINARGYRCNRPRLPHGAHFNTDPADLLRSAIFDANLTHDELQKVGTRFTLNHTVENHLRIPAYGDSKILDRTKYLSQTTFFLPLADESIKWPLEGDLQYAPSASDLGGQIQVDNSIPVASHGSTRLEFELDVFDLPSSPYAHIGDFEDEEDYTGVILESRPGGFAFGHEYSTSSNPNLFNASGCSFQIQGTASHPQCVPDCDRNDCRRALSPEGQPDMLFDNISNGKISKSFPGREAISCNKLEHGGRYHTQIAYQVMEKVLNQKSIYHNATPEADGRYHYPSEFVLTGSCTYNLSKTMFQYQRLLDSLLETF